MSCKKTPQQVRSELHQRGETITSWCKQNNCSRNLVYQVLNGLCKARYGKAHEIAVKLGLKSTPKTPATFDPVSSLSQMNNRKTGS